MIIYLNPYKSIKIPKPNRIHMRPKTKTLHFKDSRMIFHTFKIFAFLLFVSTVTFGQSTLPGPKDEENWHYTIAPYFWLAGLDGTLAIGPTEADVDLSFSDIWENLEFAFALYGEIRYKRYGLAVDWLMLRMKLEGTRPLTGNGEASVKVEPKFNVLETSFIYSITYTEKWSIDLLLGIRTWSLDNRFELQVADQDPIREADKTWVDPIVGIKAVGLFDPRWPINARLDIGGFGVGSDFSTNFMIGGGYHFAKHWTVLLQYRILSANYKDGRTGTTDYFKFDATMHGPVLSIMVTL